MADVCVVNSTTWLIVVGCVTLQKFLGMEYRVKSVFVDLEEKVKVFLARAGMQTRFTGEYFTALPYEGIVLGQDRAENGRYGTCIELPFLTSWSFADRWQPGMTAVVRVEEGSTCSGVIW